MGVHRSSVSRIVRRVTAKICNLRHRYIQFPRTRENISAVKQDFYHISQFPNVIHVGSVDGTLIPIKIPVTNEHLYVSRTGGHNINMLAVCDALLQFMYVVSKYPGSANDSFIWMNCYLRQQFERKEIQVWLLGDSG